MIYTSYWGKLKTLIQVFGKDKVISVSRWCRYWNGKRCSLLYPSVSLLKGYKNGTITEQEYTKVFNEYLNTLDVRKCYETFNGCVFVCYEKTGFCHRHLISKWLRNNGFECWEF